jgi:hypothetical protein
MWYRTCPQCHRVLIKEQLVVVLECQCGWRWGDNVSLERRASQRQKPVRDPVPSEAEM